MVHFVDMLDLNIIGIMMETSMSNMINRMTIIMKLVENIIFLSLMLQNPHSNLVGSVLFCSFSSFIVVNRQTSALLRAIVATINIKIFIGCLIF